MDDIAGINSGIVIFVLIMILYMIADTIYEIPEGVKIFVTVISTLIAVGYFGHKVWNLNQKGRSLFTPSNDSILAPSMATGGNRNSLKFPNFYKNQL